MSEWAIKTFPSDADVVAHASTWKFSDSYHDGAKAPQSTADIS
jgi:hypothetical protein